MWKENRRVKKWEVIPTKFVQGIQVQSLGVSVAQHPHLQQHSERLTVCMPDATGNVVARGALDRRPTWQNNFTTRDVNDSDKCEHTYHRVRHVFLRMGRMWALA